MASLVNTVALVAFATSTLLSCTTGLNLDTSNEASIKSAAATVARGLMSLYLNNATNTPAVDIGTFARPIYWWEAGAVWGGMVDYYAYTGDSSHAETTSQALLAQVGPNADYLVPAHKGDEGNDDQAFWALSTMSAAENNYPQSSGQPSWISISTGAFNNIIPRWNTESCNGGFKWQIYPENSYGYDYKNSISNGGLFQLAARLGRYTNNQTYIDWAEKVWDWCENVGFISDSYAIFDGADDRQNCSKIDEIQWTYNNAMFLYGAAAMWNHTGSAVWKNRVNGLLHASKAFFSPYDNATNVMYEMACEKYNTCNTDQMSFKAYLGRWMGKTTVIAPFTANRIHPLLEASAKGAAQSCSGEADGTTCGMRWYAKGYDGSPGVGQQLSALETIQSLLVAKTQAPATGGDATAASTEGKGGSSKTSSSGASCSRKTTTVKQRRVALGAAAAAGAAARMW